MRVDAFERLYEEHAAPLLAFLVYRTGSRPLYSIALNCLRDHTRRSAAEARAVERSVPVPAGEGGGFDAIEDRDRLGRAMEALSDEEREAIALRYGADLTVPEIAKLSGEKLTTVEGRVYRALRKLREELD